MPALFETVEESAGRVSQNVSNGMGWTKEKYTQRCASGLTLALGPVARIARIHMVGSPKRERRRLIDRRRKIVCQ